MNGSKVDEGWIEKKIFFSRKQCRQKVLGMFASKVFEFITYIVSLTSRILTGFPYV